MDTTHAAPVATPTGPPDHHATAVVAPDAVPQNGPAPGGDGPATSIGVLPAAVVPVDAVPPTGPAPGPDATVPAPGVDATVPAPGVDAPVPAPGVDRLVTSTGPDTPAPSTGAEPVTATEAVPAASARASRRPRDLVLSLLVLLVPVLLLVGAYRVLQKGDQPVLVDAAPALAEARSAGDFPVAVPGRLAGGWRTVSARYLAGDGQAVLRIGYLSPSGAGFQLVESDRPADALLAEELTSDARPLGVETIAGRDWQRYQGRPGERALVLLEPQRTLLVLGTGSPAELDALATALPR